MESGLWFGGILLDGKKKKEWKKWDSWKYIRERNVEGGPAGGEKEHE